MLLEKKGLLKIRFRLLKIKTAEVVWPSAKNE